MKVKIPTLQTNRLNLRSLLPSNAESLFKVYQAEGILRYFPNPVPPSLEKVQRFITNQQEHWEQHGYGNWGISLKDSDEIIGWAGLQYLPELDETEVGFLLGKPYWGRGFATEAAQVSIQFGFNYFTMDHIIALVHPDNLASRRVIEKCGLGYTDMLLLWGIDLMRYRIERISISR